MQELPSVEWLERANRLALVARLLSSTVHDVNNALQVIAGSVELLQMAPSTSDLIQRRITAIDTQTKRASRLLNELTEFVRDARSAPELVDLKALAQAVLLTRHYAITKLRIAALVDGEPVDVRANPRHLQQIMLNLVINAEEAHCSSLTIRTGHDLDHAVTVVENDAAAGLPAKDTLGIGLEVSTWLAEQHGGTLVREPLPGGGSRATLRFPAAVL